MAESNEKAMSPPYTSYKSLERFFNGLTDTGIPSRIDRSVLSGMSGSGQSAIIASCKSLGLIDDAGVPTNDMHAYIEAEEDEKKDILRKIIKRTYHYLFDGDIHLERASGAQVTEKFRDQGLSGSTLTKAVSFFLSAAKEVGIGVSPHVKAPPPPRTNGGKAKPKQKPKDKEVGQDDQPPRVPGGEDQEGMDRIIVSLRGMDDGIIYFPAELEQGDAIKAVKAAIFMMKNFYDLTDEDLK